MAVSPPVLTRPELTQWLRPAVWGMVHLLPLPGSPGYEGDPALPERRALEDAKALLEAGFRGLVVENYGDAPFFGERVPPITVAALTRVAAALRDRWPDVRLCINCLRNDAASALSVAAAVEADAIRVNVHVGAALTDQGVLTGRAAETLRLRSELAAPVRILADLDVKHAAPLAPRPLDEVARDLRDRGRADAILVTGAGTGSPASMETVAQVRAAVPDAPVLVASGVDVDTAPRWAGCADGAIVGSSIMNSGRAGRGVDPRRAQALLAAWQQGIPVRA